MKTVFNKSEVAHIWAKQTQSEGRNAQRNIFFGGKLIYSYGYHFCLGNIIKPGIVLLCDRSYSSTTAGHKSLVSYAANHLDRIYVPYPEDENLTDSNARNLDVWITRIKNELEILGNTRKKTQTKERAKIELKHIVLNTTKYFEVTGININKKLSYSKDEQTRKEFLIYLNAAENEQAGQELIEKLAKLEKSRIRQETAEDKKRVIESQKKLAEWLGITEYKELNPYKVYLRAIDGKIQTSKHVTVPLEAGKVLYKMIQVGKDIIGHNIDGYTVISLNGVLKIGCHEIERTEIERFAKTQNW